MLHPHVHFTPRIAGDVWLDCWLESYAARGCSVSLPGLPLMLKEPRGWLGGGTVLRSPTNIQTPLYSPDIWQASVSLGDLKSQIAPYGDRLVLDYLSEQSAPVTWARTRPSHCDLLLSERAKVPVTDCSVPFDTFVQRRSKRERQRIRRLVQDSGNTDQGFEFAVHQDSQSVQSVLSACLDLEQAGWKGRNRTAILDDPTHASFYRTLASRGSQLGAMRVATLHRMGKLVAFEYCLLQGDRLFALKTSYHEAFAESSPGHMLAVLHIRHCCQDPIIACYDVTGNGLVPAAHVMRYADRLETLYQLTVFTDTPRGQIARKANEFRRLLRYIKRSRRNPPA